MNNSKLKLQVWQASNNLPSPWVFTHLSSIVLKKESTQVKTILLPKPNIHEVHQKRLQRELLDGTTIQASKPSVLLDICKDKRYSNYFVAIVHLVQSYSEFANTVLPESFKCFVDLKPQLLWNCNKCSLLFPRSTLDVRRIHRQTRNMHLPVAQPNAIQSTACYYFIYCLST